MRLWPAICLGVLVACSSDTPVRVDSLQGERAEYCLNVVNRYEKLSRIPSCTGLMGDPPFNEDVTKDPPCTYQ